MNIYERKFQWKVGLLLFAILIVILSLLYTNQLASELANEERKKVETLASAFAEINKFSSTVDCNSDLTFLSGIAQKNTTIPVILTDAKGKITGDRNINHTFSFQEDTAYYYNILMEMKSGYPPVIVSSIYIDSLKQKQENKQFVYYSDSYLLRQLKVYPYIQLLIIAVFLFFAYVAFSTAKRSEQNKVWLGMAKETAHQLGTPLSSMVAWVELLKQVEDSTGQADMIATELGKDVNRLELIADRFSKIGSPPKLKNSNIVQCVERTVTYAKRRASGKIKFQYLFDEPQIMAEVNEILFDWVTENLLKNALDSMGGEGSIKVEVRNEDENVKILVTDSGKGIPKSRFKTVFEPGYSTKKRGWGLGLSLSRRIVEDYHKGKIIVASSSPEKGTTFMVSIPKKQKNNS